MTDMETHPKPLKALRYWSQIASKIWVLALNHIRASVIRLSACLSVPEAVIFLFYFWICWGSREFLLQLIWWIFGCFAHWNAAYTSGESKGHFTHEPRAVTKKLWEPKRKHSKAAPRHFQNHVVWSWTLSVVWNHMWPAPQPNAISMNFYSHGLSHMIK